MQEREAASALPAPVAAPVSAPAPREKRRRSVTLERLLDGALQVFAEMGYQAASVEDICSRAGFTRGAFYSSFRSKDELLLALYRRRTESLVAEVGTWFE